MGVASIIDTNYDYGSNVHFTVWTSRCDTKYLYLSDNIIISPPNPDVLVAVKITPSYDGKNVGMRTYRH